MDDIYTRFWNKYRLKTEACNISDADHQCYIQHVNTFINAHPEQRLATLEGADVYRHILGIAGQKTLQIAELSQLTDALRILFVEMVQATWSLNFNWDLKFSIREPVSEQVVIPDNTERTQLNETPIVTIKV
ncbi:hypothetical protein MNBD_GAMMA10-64 [hydrothermal vent metagenome]|uniref:Uncharacterized protein n=1 Tax=hydrothermal vent metagenome TaxID=652676 RepID=A0A3B0YM79_9ZZZZ